MSAQSQYITNAEGEKISVILPLADYQELLDDLKDLAAIAEHKDEETVPWPLVKEELVNNGTDQERDASARIKKNSYSKLTKSS